MKYLIAAIFIAAAIITLSGTDVLNKIHAQAEADRMAVETEYKQAMNNLSVSLAQARTEAEINEIQYQMQLAEKQFHIQMARMDLSLTHQEQLFRAWLSFVQLASYVLSAAVIMLAAALSFRLIRPALRPAAVVSEPIRPATRKPIPPMRTRIPSTPERRAYDPYDPQQVLYSKRVTEAMQAALEKRQATEEEKELIARLSAATNATRKGDQNYWKRPRAS